MLERAKQWLWPRIAWGGATLAYTNLFEYVWHRWPMHSPWGAALYRRHKWHHPATWRPGREDDFRLALTPPVLAVLAAHALGAAGIRKRWPSFPAKTVLGTMTAYLGLMDYVHKWQHAGGRTKNRILRAIRRHHMAHHAFDNQKGRGFDRSAKFNIWLPLGDWLFGTLR